MRTAWSFALVVLLTFLIFVGIFYCSCLPASGFPIFFPEAVLTTGFRNKSYVPIYGNTPANPTVLPITITPSQYVLLTSGSTTVPGTLADLSTAGGQAAGYASVFPSQGKIADLNGYARLSSATSGGNATVAVYVAPKFNPVTGNAPVFAPAISATFTNITASPTYFTVNQTVTSGTSATILADSLWAFLITTTSPSLTIYSFGGGFNYYF